MVFIGYLLSYLYNFGVLHLHTYLLLPNLKKFEHFKLDSYLDSYLPNVFLNYLILI